MSRYWSDLVNELTPYVPGEQPQHDRLTKLNTNESPYPPSPRVFAAIAEVSEDQLRRYPDPQSTALCAAVARREGLAIEQVFAGNGSDEVLAFTFMALFNKKAPLCFPDISYSFYPVWARLFGLEVHEVPLTDQYDIDVSGFPSENGGIILPNPNAPTGVLLSLADIERLLQRSTNSVVVVDEAYIDFGGDSAISLIERYPNLLVVQTMSKSRALCGMRVGFAFGQADLIEALNRVKNSFNSYPLDAVAQAAAVASLEDEAYFTSVCERVAHERGALTTGLQDIGFNVLSSMANFVFASHKQLAAKTLFEGLREAGVIVRYFDKPRLQNYLRISVGTTEQNARVLEVLSELGASGDNAEA